MNNVMQRIFKSRCLVTWWLFLEWMNMGSLSEKIFKPNQKNQGLAPQRSRAEGTAIIKSLKWK